MPEAGAIHSINGAYRLDVDQQMQRAVAAQCGLATPPKPADVADAIAIALCACLRGARGR